MSTAAPRPPKVPPPWFVHTAWRAHRALYRLSGGRFLWTTSNKRGWGALRLTTIGRTSGQERSVIIGYLEDGPNLVSIAMNGWDEGHPSWWLNLEAHPDAVVRLTDQHPRPVRARPAAEQERDRLWQRWVAINLAIGHGAATEVGEHCRQRRIGPQTASEVVRLVFLAGAGKHHGCGLGEVGSGAGVQAAAPRAAGDLSDFHRGLQRGVDEEVGVDRMAQNRVGQAAVGENCLGGVMLAENPLIDDVGAQSAGVDDAPYPRVPGSFHDVAVLNQPTRPDVG